MTFLAYYRHTLKVIIDHNGIQNGMAKDANQHGDTPNELR